MKARRIVTLALGALVAGMLATGALADGAKPAAGVPYAFTGPLGATPSNGSIALTVDGGSKAALRKMLGQPVTQTFHYGSGTEFLKWSNGVPSVVQAGDLAAGDVVSVHVRAAADASLSGIEAREAGVVGDRGPNPERPDKPLFLFRGTLSSVGSSSVTVHVAGGDRRALRLLIGQSADQTFTTDGTTIYLLWQGKVPTVIAPTQLKVGDRIAVRVRADRGSTLAQVESTPATKVAEREPVQK